MLCCDLEFDPFIFEVCSLYLVHIYVCAYMCIDKKLKVHIDKKILISMHFSIYGVI